MRGQTTVRRILFVEESICNRFRAPKFSVCVAGGLPGCSFGDTIFVLLMRSLGTSIRRALCSFACLVTLFSAPLARAQDEPPSSPLPVFEFHSGFWLNLHHTLYRIARSQRAGSSTANPAGSNTAIANLSPGEQHVWSSAISYYSKTYADNDITVSLEMILIKNQLEDFETCADLAGNKKKSCDAGLPAKLTEALDSAASVYRAHLWAEHDRANRRWISAVAPLVRRNGLDLAHRLAEIYQTNWPKDRIRVDVTTYAGSTGAYTTLDPLRVTVSSADGRNQGPEALEVLFHEASHGIADSVQDAIFRECRQREKPIPRDLWHALLFYTTGELIRPLTLDSNSSPSASSPANSSSGYVPYAVREGLYKRGWENYLRLLTEYWQPYLDGRVTFDDAIAHMVSAL